MSTTALRRKVSRIEARLRARQRPADPLLDVLREDPAALLSRAGLAPDAWQEQVLRSPASQMLLLCARQAGKSTAAAALALQTALLQPRAPVLLLSPSLRQSSELFRKVLDLFAALGRPMRVTAESALRLELANGSRVVSLPGTEANVRGFSAVGMLLIDEAARVEDALYAAVRPMLAVSRGRLVALSTPFGARGWFHDEWVGPGSWERVRITAPECPRIPETFLDEERRALGERWYKQEYLCSFEAAIGAVFDHELAAAALSNDIEPLAL
jgi:hypothetical protein